MFTVYKFRSHLLDQMLIQRKLIESHMTLCACANRLKDAMKVSASLQSDSLCIYSI